MSGIEPTRVEMTGNPLAWASKIAQGTASAVVGMQKRSASRNKWTKSWVPGSTR